MQAFLMHLPLPPAELDAMKEAAEAQILSLGGLLGPYARVVSAGEGTAPRLLPCPH